jgi:hypothetical protein
MRGKDGASIKTGIRVQGEVREPVALKRNSFVMNILNGRNDYR